MHNEPEGQVAAVPGAESQPAEASPVVEPAKRSRWRWFWILLAFVAIADWLLGTAVRLTIRDAGDIFTPVFYASPLPVLAVTACVGAEALRKLGRKWSARLMFGLAAWQMLSWLPDAVHFRAEALPEDSMRMVFWNVSRGAGGYPELARKMLSYDPDLICLVEASGEGQLPETWQPHLPGFKIFRLGSGMMVMARGEVFGVEPGMIREVARYRNLRVKIGQKQFGLCLIDIRSDPMLPRTLAFERLPNLLENFQREPKLLAGDFNTPPDSELFAHIRPEMQNAFDAKGQGYRETWPVFTPVLSLDQVWGDRQIQFHSCQHGWSIRSDHRPVIVDFSVK